MIKALPEIGGVGSKAFNRGAQKLQTHRLPLLLPSNPSRDREKDTREIGERLDGADEPRGRSESSLLHEEFKTVGIPCICVVSLLLHLRRHPLRLHLRRHPCLFRWIFRLHRLILRSAQLVSAEDFQQPDLAYPPIIDHSNPKTNQRRPHLLVPRSEVCCSGETIHRFSSSVPTETFTGFRL
ncbi:hypothetical protein LXL04_024426 [Taraxacum kok-saghyz]